MSGCFDFRLRASTSIDLDSIHVDPNDVSRIFPMSFSKLFRSRSDGSVKTARSNSEGPSARARPRTLRSPSPVTSSAAGIRRRRYVRVVRGDDAHDARHAAEKNEHVIFRSRSFSATDRTHLKKSASADAGVAAVVASRGSQQQQLQRTASPYTSSGHTILKKYTHSFDGGSGTAGDRAAAASSAAAAGMTASTSEMSPPNSKHTSFREEVEILEYDTHGKALLVNSVTHTKKLNYEEDDEDEDDSLNIDDCSLDDDLESTDFISLTDIQDETLAPASATTLAILHLTSSSPASINNKSSMEADCSAEAATLTDSAELQGNRRYCADDGMQTSSAGSDYSVSAFAEKDLSLRTTSSASPSTVVTSRQPTLIDDVRGSRRCGGAPNVVVVVDDVHQLPVSESCHENRLACSTTLISCDDNNYCPAAIPSSSVVSSRPSISVSSCIQSSKTSICAEKSSTTCSPGQPSTGQLQAQTKQQKPD